MMPVDLIAAVASKLRTRFRGTAVIEPLWTPPPPDDLLTRMRKAVAELEAPLNRAAELAQEEEERATAPLLPSVDYRTNPRPVQVKVTEREPTVEDLKLAIQQRGPRGDALRSAVLGAVILPKPGNGQDVRP